MVQVEHIVPAQDEIGETPVWIAREKALYWIDIEGRRVHRLEPASGTLATFGTDFPITALRRRASGGWVAASKTGVYFWDHRTGISQFIIDPEANRPGVRFNDGAIDSKGRFLLGTLNENDLNAPDGSLYRLDIDGSINKLDSGFAVSNGIGFSPDGRTLYFTDMFHNQILAYDYDLARGSVSRRRTFAKVPAETGLPDGLAVDAEGFVWSAHFAGGRITRYDPDGAIERQIAMPVANPTCLAFGGENMDELYVTSAWFLMDAAAREAQPSAGDLFRIRPGVRGLEENAFAG